MLSLTGAASAASATNNPGTTWERFPSPEDAGFRSSALVAMEQTLYTKPTTSLMIIKSGKIAYSYGDIAQASNVASVRKSVLSILYGNYVASGRIDLKRTLGDLGINEGGEGLLPIEKTATIRDLLMSSSGVYWPAGSPGGNETAPVRGSKKPGVYFHYNNWDFNVAGAIFQKLTGKSVFKALQEDLVSRLQFEDFTPARQLMLGYPTDPSRYQSYQMCLSGRDLARLGVLMLNRGVWNGSPVVPLAWVKESTALYVKAADMVSRKNSPSGYAYMWWKPSESRKGPEWTDSYLAYGKWGQFMLVLPAVDTVIVHRRAITDEYLIAFNLGKISAPPAGGEFGDNDFLPIADRILAARK